MPETKLSRCTKCYERPAVSQTGGLGVCQVCSDKVDLEIGDTSGTDWVISTVDDHGVHEFLCRNKSYTEAKLEWSKMPDIIDSHFLRRARPEEIADDDREVQEAALAEAKSQRRAGNIGLVVEVLVLCLCIYLFITGAAFSSGWMMISLAVGGLISLTLGLQS